MYVCFISSGFITYDTCESADKAISEKNETMIGDCRVKVSLARRQPLLHRVGNQTWKELCKLTVGPCAAAVASVGSK